MYAFFGHRLAAWSALALLVTSGPVPAEPAYRHYLAGNAGDVVTPTTGLLVLQGGGTDVDENYVEMGRASGGGDFVVLRASGGDEYNAYIHALCGCDSVETLVFEDRQVASDPFVIETIRNAEALFVAGGDQSRYVRFWKDTAVEDAINYVAAKPAPVGGTSAGMAILGEFAYSAMSDESLTSGAALADPFHEDLTLSRDFVDVPILRNIVTDQHLQERDRIGRTMALLARLMDDGWTEDARAIAADRETALHIDPATGAARVFATKEHETPYVYFMRSQTRPSRCEPLTPLTFHNVSIYRIGPGGTFDIDSWTGGDGLAYTLGVEEGVLSSTRDEVY